MVQQKEATGRLSKKSESRGQYPEPKNRELKKMMRLFNYQAHRTGLGNEQ